MPASPSSSSHVPNVCSFVSSVVAVDVRGEFESKFKIDVIV
jgi:hypothetical protein